MFVRKKKNRSASVGIVIVDKIDGTYREIKSFGASSDIVELLKLEKQASDWISQYGGQQTVNFDETAQVVAEARKTIFRIERSLQHAPQAILNHIYDSIGFGGIDENILRNLVIARICQPLSKVATVEKHRRLARLIWKSTNCCIHLETGDRICMLFIK